MTDELFEYKSKKKTINYGSNFLGISITKGLKCDWRCSNINLQRHYEILNFTWKFKWDDLKTKGIDRLSGSIIVQAYDQTSEILDDVKIEVDLKESSQKIEKQIQFGHHERYKVKFEYSLTPHYTQIEEVNEESMLMLTPSEQNDAILVVEEKKIHVNKAFLSCFSEFFRALFSSNYKEGQMDEIPIEGVSYNDFKRLLGTICPKPIFPTDETVEKLLELADRFMMPSVIRHVEHHLLHMSKLGNEKKMLMGETYGMPDLLEKMIHEIDTIEKAKKWKQSSEFIHFSDNTKAKVFQKFF